jgi:hypothetical protein
MQKWCPGPESKPKTIGGNLPYIDRVAVAPYPSGYPSDSFPPRHTIPRPPRGHPRCEPRHIRVQCSNSLNGYAPTIHQHTDVSHVPGRLMKNPSPDALPNSTVLPAALFSAPLDLAAVLRECQAALAAVMDDEVLSPERLIQVTEAEIKVRAVAAHTTAVQRKDAIGASKERA